MTTPPLAPASVVDAQLPAAVVDADGTRRMSAVPYSAPAGFRPLELDLVLPPARRGPSPVVVFFHGGGWRFGDRRSVGPSYRTADVFARFVTAGIAVASVDYRLSGEARWPAQLHDARAAVAWLRRRGPEMGLDAERVVAWGESAGGHLASMLGLTGPPVVEGPVGLTAVVAWYAPSDLVGLPADAHTDAARDDTREALLLGSSIAADPEAAAQAGPLTHVSGSAPPFLLLHGRADRFVPVAQSERLHHALETAGASSSFTTYADADHLWLGAPDAAVDALDRTVAFVAAALGLRGSAVHQQAAGPAGR